MYPSQVFLEPTFDGECGRWAAAQVREAGSRRGKGPDRVRRGERVDGADTILAAHPTESREDIQNRLYRSRHYASPPMLTRHWIAEVLYAGIGAGLLESVPSVQADDTVDLVLQAMARGRLLRWMFAAHGQDQVAGFPTGE